jgi:acyl-coenzyme A thioesterase PaaI-like protein
MTWTHDVVAHNTATESTNRMHDDTVAATYGFRGGLVPGVDVWAYATRPCVDRWGPAFLERGSLEMRFASPVYDGEPVVAALDDDGGLAVCGPDGDVRATGSAGLSDDMPPPKELAVADLPASPPAATADLLAPGTALGTLRFHHRAEPHVGYLADVRETSGLYDGGTICHPGFLARQANYVLSSSVRLGPWIHVSTRAQHRRSVRDGDVVEVRGVVTDERERKGHRFVDLDVEVTANGEPAWSASHTAIWRPRRS